MSTKTISPSAPLVTIVGAGPGGLLLARYLQIHHVPVVIYERESSRNARAQGGTLDLHEATGLTALKETGLMDLAEPLMRWGAAEAMKVMDKDGKVYIDENDNTKREPHLAMGSSRPEIDRTELRNLLIDSLEPNTIQWDHGLKSVRAIDDNNYELTFISSSLSPITTQILIGADGTFSRVRPLLHNIKPHYSGLVMYDTQIQPENMTDELVDIVGGGTAMILDHNKGVLPQMNSGRRCKVYPSMVVSETWLENNPLPETGKKEWIAKHYQGWKYANELIMATDEEGIVARKIYEFNPDLKWDSKLSGVTVIGDAAHVMAPSGEGVNQAMADGLSLGRTLVKITRPQLRASPPPFPLSLFPITAPPSEIATLIMPSPQVLHTAIRAFEKRMMARVRPEMVQAQEMKDALFSPNAAANFKRWFYLMIARVVLWSPVVYVNTLLAGSD